LTGSIGGSVRLDYINRYGPSDAWVTLDTVTLTNTSQLYFDVSASGQPQRLYRQVQVYMLLRAAVHFVESHDGLTRLDSN
jgi:hypothetical protein